MGVALVIIHFQMGFSIIDHPLRSTRPFQETSIWLNDVKWIWEYHWMVQWGITMVYNKSDIFDSTMVVQWEGTWCQMDMGILSMAIDHGDTDTTVILHDDLL